MKKRITAFGLMILLFMTSGITAYAAPKTMPDGTVFDAEYYAQNNPDVVAAVGDSEDALWSHYVNNGRAEGRKPAADSNVNAAVQTSGSVVSPATMINIFRLDPATIDKVLNVSLGIGIYDSDSIRNYTQEGSLFDEKAYAKAYPEVAKAVGKSHSALWNHYKTQGVYEGKRGFIKNISDSRYINDKKTMLQMVDVVNSICTPSMSGREKVYAINNYITGNYSYDYNYAADRNAADLVTTEGYLTFFLRYKKGICSDYAYLGSILLCLAGFPVQWCDDGGSHAWNKAQVDGVWYYFDFTWNDTSGTDSYLFMDEAKLASLPNHVAYNVYVPDVCR